MNISFISNFFKLKSERQLVSFALFTFIIFAILSNLKSPPKINPDAFKNLISGNDKGFMMPGASPFVHFEPYLALNGYYSFITDSPYNNLPFSEKDEHPVESELFLVAQSYFAPRVLNRNPAETLAIIFCSSDAAAEKRFSETGYEWLHHLADGKGIAVKK